MNDINNTVISIVNNELLKNFEIITALNANTFEILFAGITILFIVMGFSHFNYKQHMVFEIGKQLEKEKEEFLKESLKDLKKLINQYKYESQQEEFLRNIIFKDLTKILASEIKGDKEHQLNEKFSLHADRLEVITQLTSGDENEVRKALRRLSTKTYNKIIRLQSFIDYIEVLEKQASSMDIEEELSILKNIMSR
jgi:hypothetical protein